MTHFISQGVGFEIVRGVKDNLGYPLAVPEVDEDDSPVVTPAAHPAHEDDSLADLVKVQLSQMMSSFFVF
jgi:hypothetical protein